MTTIAAPGLTAADALAYLCSSHRGVEVLKRVLFIASALLALATALLALTGHADSSRPDETGAAELIDAPDPAEDWQASTPRE